MIKFLSRAAVFAALAALGTFAALPAVSQTYPTQSPVYTPNPLVPVVNKTATGDVAYNVNGPGTVFVRISGTFTGLAAEVDCTESRAASPTWTGAQSLQPVGAGQGRVTAIAATGLWYFNSAAYAQCRLHITALSTGSVNVAMSGGVSRAMEVSTFKRTTYRATFVGLAPAASLTDLFTINGAAGATIRVKRISCSGISTANASFLVSLVKKSVADTGGTSTTATDVPLDSLDAAGVATVKGYTANPTVGAAVGTIGVGTLITNTLATSSIEPTPVTWNFGSDNEEEATLRSAAEGLAVNGRGASMTAGAAVDCEVEWTE